MRFLVFGLFMMMSFGMYAEGSFPFSCKPLPIQGSTVKLSKATLSIIMLHNISDVDLWITHPISEPSASAGFSSRLQSKHWSAFALGEHPFELSCIESKPGHEQQVPCSGVLVACQWLDIPHPDALHGPYWAGEDMPLSELLAHLGSRGFKLPEPKN